MYFTINFNIYAIFKEPNLFIMRTAIIVLCLFFCFTSCNDSTKNKKTESNSIQNDSIQYKDDIGTSAQDQPIQQNNSDTERDLDKKPTSVGNNEKSSNAISAGVYINTEHLADTNCNCYCIDVKLNATSDLCLTKDNLFIKGRFEQRGNNINIYYSGKSAGNTDSKIPWDDFETGTPIAVLSPTANGVKLDWKGFSIDGEIAIDYALYGKKTLEGTYKKK